MLVGTHHAHSTLPAEIPMRDPSMRKSDYKVSADAQVFAVWRGENGRTFVGFRNQPIELREIAQASASNAHPDQDFEHIHLNADGNFLINIIRGEIFIRSLPKGDLVWHGILEGIERPSYATAFNFDPTTKEFLTVLNGKLFKHRADASGIAKKIAEKSISFVPEGHSQYANFVLSAAFSTDGRQLFIGNMDGEVLSLSIGGEDPTVQWRHTIFDRINAGGFNDEGSRYIQDIFCADNCATLLVNEVRGHQVATLDAATGKILAIKFGDDRYRVYSVGEGRFLMSTQSHDRSKETRSIVNSELKNVMPKISIDEHLIFGFKNGYAHWELNQADKMKSIRFVYLPGTSEAHQREQESKRKKQVQYSLEQEAHKENIEARRRELVAEQKREAKYRAQVVEFRRKVSSGDDSHCGLVIERKGNIVLVETMIGQKWLKLSQLHPPGAKTCTFINNVLQD